MLTSKKSSLRPILESSGGTHLSIYINNQGDLEDLKAQISDIINQSTKHLSLTMSLRERNKFLGPFESLLLDARIFKQMKGNIGIFRNQDFFNIINIPIEVKTNFYVATSFHVKPLLKWLQADQEFLLASFETDSVHLYKGSQDSFKLVDSVLLPECLKKSDKQDEAFIWLSEWVSLFADNSTTKLFITDKNSIIGNVKNHIKYNNFIKLGFSNTSDEQNISDICSSIREILKKHSKLKVEKALEDFHFAEEKNRTCKNIFKISKAVVEGRVKKLVITDEINVFGTINKGSGYLSIHPFDLDHEDDDVLDDLAQIVLRQGGEVLIASRVEIPNSLPILAILDADEDSSKKTLAPHNYAKSTQNQSLMI